VPDPGSILAAVAQNVWKKRAYFVGASALVLVNVVADTDYLPSRLRFYHEGWMLGHKAWIVPLAIVAIASLILCLTRTGLIVVASLCLCLGVLFAATYLRDADGSGDALFVSWLAYRTALALAVGLGAALLERASAQTP
jgi:hypothetical protein